MKAFFLLFALIVFQYSYASQIPADESLTAQQSPVRGTVTDADGAGVAGVSVIVSGTTSGTITDANGAYTLNAANSNATLEFSSLGYISQSVPVGGRSVVDVVMATDAFAMDEVVVVGYGVMRKSDVTGSISITDGDDILKQQSFSAIDGLKGKAAGVNIFSNSGMPGGMNRIIIRGMSTIQGSTDPLFIVDGVAMDASAFNYMNPNDIERIEVLKDASSAAIYGARAANGVVMVTTKRGARGAQGAVISYSGSVSVSQVRKYIDVMNAEEWLEAFMISKENANAYQGKSYVTNRGTGYYFKDPGLFNSDGSPIYDTDWQREATRSAVSHNHQLSIQQSGENMQVGAFLNYTDRQGVFLGNYQKRVSGRLAFDAKPKKWLSTSVNLMVNHSWAQEAEETGGHQMVRRTILEMLPFMPVKFPDGTWSSSTTISDAATGFENMANPVQVLKEQQRLRFRTQIFGNAALTFHLAPGLDLRTQFGVDNYRSKFREYSPNNLLALSYPDGRARLDESDTFFWQENTYLTYIKEIGKSYINLTGGVEWQEWTRRTFGMEVRGFKDNFFLDNNLGVGTQHQKASSEYRRWAMNSYFLRGAYTYDNRYTVTVTGRMDGSSRFGDNNKYAFFPSAGLAWNAINENFLAESNTISNLKLHTSYGVTGNSDITPYSSQATMSSSTTLINGVLVPTARPGRVANPNLEWEKTYTFDIGFELGLFDNRLSFDVSYYNKQTRDVLLQWPIPWNTGFQQVMYNVGQISNEGIDFMINSTNIENENFRWTTTLNGNYNKNNVKALAEGGADILVGDGFVNESSVILREGFPMSSFWGYERLGIYTLEDQAAGRIPAGNIVGSAKRSEGKTIIGKGLPDVTGSFINNLRWKNLDLTVDFQFSLGSDLYQEYKHSLQDRFGYGNGEKSILHDAWSPSNPDTMVQAIRDATKDGQDSQPDSGWVVSGDYLRLNMVQLGYTFNPKVVKPLSLSSLRVYFTASNVWVLHDKKFTGYDPEGSSRNNIWGQNVIFYQYPKPRDFVFGVSATF
jgi:TonB-linked SusC/RagA family outer membrane protein